ncbi:hypothetical protein [Lentzea sp. NPDC055074]
MNVDERSGSELVAHATTAEEFHRALRNLMTTTGMSYRQMAENSQRIGLPLARSTAYNIAKGDLRRTPSWSNIEAFIRACGVEDTEAWRSSWLQVVAGEHQNESLRPKPSISVDERINVSAVTNLISAMKDVDVAVIRLGSIVVVKHDGQVIATTLSEGDIDSLGELSDAASVIAKLDQLQKSRQKHHEPGDRTSD